MFCSTTAANVSLSLAEGYPDGRTQVVVLLVQVAVCGNELRLSQEEM